MITAPSFSFFQEALEHLHPSLASKKHIDKALSLIRLFPNHLFSNPCNLWLEMPLNEENNWADVSFIIYSLRSILKENSMAFADFFAKIHGYEREEWKRLIHFLDGWSETDPGICFEFDVGSSPEWPPSPNVFIVSHKSGDDLVSFASQIAHRLNHAHLSPKVIDQMQIYFEFCAISKIRLLCGFMMARNLGKLRVVCYRSKKFFDLIFFEKLLMKARYSFDLQPLFSFLKKAFPFVDTIAPSLDIGETPENRLGIEFFVKNNEWEPFLSFLLKESFITLEKKQACLSWIGYDVKKTDDPEHNHLIVRDVSHIKMIYIPGEPLFAKVYLRLHSTKKSHPHFWHWACERETGRLE